MKKTSAILCAIFFIMIIIPNCSDALCVKVPKANLRSGPGTNYGIVWEVYKYMPFKKVGVSLSGDWYAVRDVDGDVNWMYKKLVTDNITKEFISKVTLCVIPPESFRDRVTSATRRGENPSLIQRYRKIPHRVRNDEFVHNRS